MQTCYNLYWTIEMLMTCDGPAVIKQTVVEDHNVFIPCLHSMPAIILIVLRFNSFE